MENVGQANNIFYSILFLLLMVRFALLYFTFRLEINGNNFRIVELEKKIFNKNREFLLSDIGVIYIRQTPFSKLFGLRNILIELRDPKEWEETSIKAFGLSKKTFNAGMPGKYGGLITIPSVPKDEVDKIVNIIKSKTNVLVKDIGMGYPYHNHFVYFSYFILYGFLIVALLMFLLWLFLEVA